MIGSNLLRYLLTICFLVFFILPNSSATKVVEFTVDGAIGPATADYLSQGIGEAQNAGLILINLDTPGGLDSSTRQIVQEILGSKVPIVVYVAPNGARAASAGTFLLYASTLAVMAPGTHLGAASPVNLMSEMDEQGGSEKSTMDKKITNDSIAYIRSLAQLRERDPIFAEKAIQNAATMTASEALNAKVINFIANNQTDLLSQLNGQMVMQDGQKIQLQTKNAEIESRSPNWRTRFLEAITNPTVAYMILLLGIYGIFFEFLSPGFVLPGVVGAIALLVALYALQLLSVNYAGLGLIILGLIFIIAEAYTPSFGALGLGGTLAFVLGSILLIDSDQQSYQIARSAILAMAVTNLIILLGIVTMTLKARKKQLQHGVNLLVGAEGRALGEINVYGQAVIKGEIWSVHAKDRIVADSRIKVIATDGLQLEVEEISAQG
ncbi:hypothetical protein BN59_00315 [Legionella massiliensis]|uniref:Uncharacterized protein n=1 Tax=Legionella massiliensis TaxID=1034943 RepID=A0A078KSK2_9GAMM|nr:nodulation protein NfeD [Legionella massiliensis]CDZ76051.1 hypothetical protein BN59_00315 [Legionella massiliensis]CEE11789.1 hypothetical protein BN1094_00315 [Legionella massiliensis]